MSIQSIPFRLSLHSTNQPYAQLPNGPLQDRELLTSVARTSLRTKLLPELADQLTDIVTDAVLIVRKDGEPVDLHMVRAWMANGY